MSSKVYVLTNLLAAALAGEAHGQRSPDVVRCDYTRRAVCTPTGCEPIPGGSAFLVVPGLSQIRSAMFERQPVEVRRCDDKGCTPVTAIAAEAGVFLNLAAPGSGYLLRLSSLDESL